MPSTADVRAHDGVAVATCGDAILVVYEAAARLPRSRWLFDPFDELAANNSGGIIGLMAVLRSADPPDRPTRVENAARVRKLGPELSQLREIIGALT